MRIVYQNVVWLLIFVAYNYLCLADHRDVITVGALFDNEDAESRLVLESAIKTTNTMQQNLHYVLQTRVLSNSDTFKCCKLGKWQNCVGFG
jgi:hypothetical protein